MALVLRVLYQSHSWQHLHLLKLFNFLLPVSASPIPQTVSSPKNKRSLSPSAASNNKNGGKHPKVFQPGMGSSDILLTPCIAQADDTDITLTPSQIDISVHMPWIQPLSPPTLTANKSSLSTNAEVSDDDGDRNPNSNSKSSPDNGHKELEEGSQELLHEDNCLQDQSKPLKANNRSLSVNAKDSDDESDSDDDGERVSPPLMMNPKSLERTLNDR